VTTALRSGYGITQALESVAEEAEEPARSEFAHVLVESRMGRDLSSAMHALAERMESKDLEWVVSAIDINRETGGNLSEILQAVSGTIRERGRIGRQVRTLTAEGALLEDAVLGEVGGLVGGPVALRLLLHVVAPRLAADLGAAGGEQGDGEHEHEVPERLRHGLGPCG
jgi:tight adherence protein B